MKSNSEARPSAVVRFYYTFIFTILQPLGSGYQEIKVKTKTEHEATGQRQRTEDHGEVFFAGLFFFFFLPCHTSHV